MDNQRIASASNNSGIVEGSQRKPVDATAASLMLLFCLVLGFQQVAIKGVAEDISPIVQMALRSAMAGCLVGVLAFWRGIRWRDVQRHWAPGLLVGLGFATEFAFIAWGLTYTLASHMSVFLYTAPIFAALGLHLWVPGEQLSIRQWWGVGLAFAGMVIAMAPSGAYGIEIIIGDALGLLAGLSWAVTTVVIRKTSLSEAPAELTLSYQLSVTVLLLLPVAVMSGQLMSAQFVPMAVASLGFQALIISFGALLLWFTLLRRYRASQLGVFSFLAPLFGILFGTLLLNEPLSINFLLGGSVILLGIVLVTR
ncbi:DMT family transporter [Vreelandella arcis]|uniref:Permease of the drug/metabolite transporter (DMT) superfamily n=1 Tax=Vreelandella arcis TaxID=416873 RepID=A0A1H0I054_9GAMM|nr:DMT family transporter [Halomonas arcis]SDO24471.1 Permease of the drug/metabolite transporter (DMT) superfamily [Halomonas arcis]